MIDHIARSKAIMGIIEDMRHFEVLDTLQAIRARRLMVFVDTMNILEGTGELSAKGYRHIDPHRVADCIRMYPGALEAVLVKYPRFRCIRSYWYDAKVPGNHRMHTLQQALHEQLGRQPYTELVLGKHSGEGKSRRQKGVDIALAVNMLQNAFRGNYDCAALVSGDADFAPVVSEVKATGKQVICASFTWQLSKDEEIVYAADEFIALEQALAKHISAPTQETDEPGS